VKIERARPSLPQEAGSQDPRRVIYGNDDGLIAERAAQLAKTVCEDLKDRSASSTSRANR